MMAKEQRCCSGKRAYTTLAIASRIASGVNAKLRKNSNWPLHNRNPVHSYKCPVCGEYHIGQRIPRHVRATIRNGATKAKRSN